MIPKSILDLDEARNRLAKMEEDHREIVLLMDKLRTVRDKGLTIISRLEVQEEKAESLLQQASAAVSKTREISEKLTVDSQRILNEIVEKVAAQDSCIDESMKEQADEMTHWRTSFGQRFEAWVQEQREAYESFRDEHKAGLEVISSSYDRMKAVFDSVKIQVEVVDASIDQIRRQAEEKSQALRSSVLELFHERNEEAVKDQSEFFENLEAQMKSTVQATSSLERRVVRQRRLGFFYLFLFLLLAAYVAFDQREYLTSLFGP